MKFLSRMKNKYILLDKTKVLMYQRCMKPMKVCAGCFGSGVIDCGCVSRKCTDCNGVGKLEHETFCESSEEKQEKAQAQNVETKEVQQIKKRGRPKSLNK